MTHIQDPPSYISSDHETTDDDDYIDRMAMDSFPASDPPSTSPSTIGTPLRGTKVRPETGMGRGPGRSAPRAALLRNVGSIVASLCRIGFKRMRGALRAA